MRRRGNWESLNTYHSAGHSETYTPSTNPVPDVQLWLAVAYTQHGQPGYQAMDQHWARNDDKSVWTVSSLHPRVAWTYACQFVCRIIIMRWCTKGDVLCNTYRLSNLLLELSMIIIHMTSLFHQHTEGITTISRPRKATLLILAGIYKGT